MAQRRPLGSWGQLTDAVVEDFAKQAVIMARGNPQAALRSMARLVEAETSAAVCLLDSVLDELLIRAQRSPSPAARAHPTRAFVHLVAFELQQQCQEREREHDVALA